MIDYRVCPTLILYNQHCITLKILCYVTDFRLLRNLGEVSVTRKSVKIK